MNRVDLPERRNSTDPTDHATLKMNRLLKDKIKTKLELTRRDISFENSWRLFCKHKKNFDLEDKLISSGHRFDGKSYKRQLWFGFGSVYSHRGIDFSQFKEKDEMDDHIGEQLTLPKSQHLLEKIAKNLKAPAPLNRMMTRNYTKLDTSKLSGRKKLRALIWRHMDTILKIARGEINLANADIIQEESEPTNTFSKQSIDSLCTDPSKSLISFKS